MPEVNVRLALYRRLMWLSHPEDVDAMANELIDRFGSMPDEMAQLLDAARLRIGAGATTCGKSTPGRKRLH